MPEVEDRHIHSLNHLAEFADGHRRAGRKIVLCHGCFDVIHPGHLRYLQFAHEQGDVLVVSITADDAIEKSDGLRPIVPQELRAEGLEALKIVDRVVIASWPTAEPVIHAMKPDIYVKGREYEHSRHDGFLAEKQAVESEGGRVLFSSGDIVFSSTSLLDRLSSSDTIDPGMRFGYWLRRNGIHGAMLHDSIAKDFSGKRVVVVGDAIIDRYTFCDAHAVAGEAPVLSVRPIEERDFIGGAAVVAAHLAGLGADVHLITASGEDEHGEWLCEELMRQGIDTTSIPLHQSTPFKQRFVVDSQKILKVDRVHARPLDSFGEARVLDTLRSLRKDTDAVIFTDFGCGVITLNLLDQAIPLLREHVPILTGDVSGDRRSILACRDFDLLCPNERELRGVMGDFEKSLPTLADQFMRRLHLGNLLVTMGARGAILFRPRENDPEKWFQSRLRSDHLPAHQRDIVDPLGAGDACLAVTTLGLAAGMSSPEAASLGMAAAGIQASRVGNPPLDMTSFSKAVDRLSAMCPTP